MNHFQTNSVPGPIAHVGQLPPAKPSPNMAPAGGLSQAELRDIVLAVLG